MPDTGVFHPSPELTHAGTTDRILFITGGGPKFLLRNAASGDSILLTNAIPGDPNKAWESSGAAVLEFECGDSGCALNRLWIGGGPAYRFSHPKAEQGERTHLAVIRLAVSKTN